MKHKRGYWPLVLGIGLVLSLINTLAHAKVYADKSKELFHAESCAEKERIKPGNLRVFDSEPEAESRGFYPCKICIPPIGPPSLVTKQGKKLSLPVNRNPRYIGDLEKKTYHNEWCLLIPEIAAGKRKVFTSAKTAHRRGLAPCSECNPPVLFKRDRIEIGPSSDSKPATEPEGVSASAQAETVGKPVKTGTEEEDALPEAEIE